jgi:MauM/NapG family ferredoxin protein
VNSTRRNLFSRFLGNVVAGMEPEVTEPPAESPVELPDPPAPPEAEVRPVAAVARTDTGRSPLPVSTRPVPVLRPPGACAEPEFLANCTRCGDCITACPHDAIVLAPARLSTAAGTPIIAPATQPCLLCLDQPCATACKPGVLSRDRPPAIGKAMIQPMYCLNAMRKPCSVCVDSCPVPDAITVRAGKSTIVTALCVGCGVCQHVCPAPVNAILVLPTLDRLSIAKTPVR